MTAPGIGVTIGYDPQREGVFLLRRDYLRSVEDAGGLPLVLAPGLASQAPRLLDGVRGLLLSGGSDLDPGIYGEPRHASVSRVIRERDEFELALVREALDRDLPLLGICRGAQVLNVACGGTLVQDIPSQILGATDHDPERERWETVHAVRIVPGTRLFGILGKDEVAVNSSHHQAVRQLGAELVVSARAAEDGVVEGIEAPSRRFALGVQWHPESFVGRAGGFQTLFDALVAAAA